MTKDHQSSAKENSKPVGLKGIIGVLRPFREWLKNTPAPPPVPPSAQLHRNQIQHPCLTPQILPNHQQHQQHLVHQQMQQQQQQNQLHQVHLQQVNRQQQPPAPPPRPAPIVGAGGGGAINGVNGISHYSFTPTNLSSSINNISTTNNNSIHGNQNNTNNINTSNNNNNNNNSHYYSTTPVSMLHSNTSSTPISNSTSNSASTAANGLPPLAQPLNQTLDHEQHQQQLQQQQNHFKRSATARMSLPIMQQNMIRRQAYSQLQKRGHLLPQSLGHIYLQHSGETKQANLPNELTALDTIRALFVCAFPNLLTMEYMSQPHVKIYIYNPNCNIFYELSDIEDVRHESVLRIHQSDPVLALQPQYQQLRHSFHHHQLAPPSAPVHLHQQSQQRQMQQQQHHQLQQLHQHQMQQQHQQHHHHGQLIPPPKPRRMVFLPPY